MLRSLYSGISGMQGMQTKLDVVGNNIANVNTVGFKKGRIMFQDMLSQNMSGVTAPDAGNRGGVNPTQIGLGVRTGTIENVFTDGASMTTNVTTDLAIEGDGFFMIAPPGQDFETPLYTRAGNFTFDSERQLVTSDGHFVVTMVPELNEDNMVLVDHGLVQEITEEEIDFDTNFAANIENWAEVGLPEGATNVETTMENQLVIDEHGNLSVEVEVEYELDGEEHTELVYVNVMWDGDNFVAGDDPSDPDTAIEPTAVPYDVIQQGWSEFRLPEGLDGFEIAGNGEIIGRTADGQTVGIGFNQETGQFGIFEGPHTARVGVGFVDNPGGLRKVGGSLYEMTSNANPNGDHTITTIDASGRSTAFRSGELEMSNVDLTEEFTEMIVAQRGFQANSRSITTSDEILQEVVNLKR